MATHKARMPSREIRTLFNLGAIRDLTDGQLLERFASGGGEGAELAFAALVERHAAMVMRVCRARLADPNDAHDAAQAAFVVLVQKARTLWVRDSIGPWLHQVAVRTASGARGAKLRRGRLERGAARPEAYQVTHLDGWEQALHQEICRLPDRYRVPIILCDLQGHSCEEVATRLGRPVGTIKSWRSRGRDHLRRRLVRLGLAPASVLATNIAKGSASGPTADASAAATVRAAMDSITAGTVPTSVLGLAKGVLKAMFISKLRTTAITILALGALAAGVGTIGRVGAQDASKGDRDPQVHAVDELLPPFPPVKDLADTWPLSLREAIRIGLKNSKAIHVVETPKNLGRDAQFVIAATDHGVDPYRFRSEVMAHVRSVAQQYWALNQGLVDVWAAEKAVELGEGIVKREEAKHAAGLGDPNNLAEAREQVDRFKLDLVDRTASVIMIERQLRNILGMTWTETRRIVPMTAPLDAKVTLEWDDALKIMMDRQPDVLRQRSILQRPELGEDAPGKSAFEEVVHQTTHALARFFLEIDSNHKLFQTATRLRTAAAARMDAQAAVYEAGKITIDRHLDAVNRYAAAVRKEAEFQGRYNTAIAALEEAKGTLLDHEGIVIANRLDPVRAPAPRPDVVNGPAAVDPGSGTTYSFRFMIGRGSEPFEVRGSFTVAPATESKRP